MVNQDIVKRLLGCKFLFRVEMAWDKLITNIDANLNFEEIL